MLNKLYLWFINFLLNPLILGIYSGENGQELVVMRPNHLEFRLLGSRKWQNWETNPNFGKIYDNQITIATPENISFSALTEFLFKEKIKNPVKAFIIKRQALPYRLALQGDLQGQYHYGIVKDLIHGNKETISFIFPNTQFDLYDRLPETDSGFPILLTGGSLGWLASLPFNKTLKGIKEAKARLS